MGGLSQADHLKGPEDSRGCDPPSQDSPHPGPGVTEGRLLWAVRWEWSWDRGPCGESLMG